MAATTKKSVTKKTAAKPRAAPKSGSRRPAKAKAPARPSRSGAAPRRSSAPRRPASRAVLARNAQKLARETVAQIVPAEAIALLEQDHRETEAFFAQFEEDEERQPELARKICLALTVHATIEEEILYPAAREAAPGGLLPGGLVNEAEVEHAAAKQLIAEIEAAGPEDRLFAAKVKVLGEYVKHHIAEEEGKLFPMLRESGVDLLSLGMQLAERRVALLTELAPARLRQQPGTSGRRAAQSRKPQRRASSSAKPRRQTAKRRR